MSKTPEEKQALTRKRYRAEKRFKLYGLFAVGFACLCLFVLLATIFSKGGSAFFSTQVTLDVHFDAEALALDDASSAEDIAAAYYQPIIKNALYQALPDITASERRAAGKMLSSYAGDTARDVLLDSPQLLNRSVPLQLRVSSEVDQIVKGNVDRELSATKRQLSDPQLAWLEHLEAQGKITQVFDFNFITSGDSREPELAGLGGALSGSFFTLLICFLVSFPLGLAAATYLEEFAPKNRFTTLIEININNLAAVPSIIYGLLGLAVLLNVIGVPRSTPIAGGLVLALMTLPVIIISARAALRAVPPSIRQGALAMGASPMQVVLHHVIPLALPGTLTGTIIGLSRALGETAPLLMIGMVAFIVDVPASPGDPASALPVQIYLWAESAERGFIEKTSAAIMVILGFLIMMNLSAVLLRTKFERRW